MTEAEFASLESALGSKIVLSGNVFWRQVRPLFYRPLIPTEALDPQAITPPCRWPGGFQYAVGDSELANSRMQFRLFRDLQAYSPDKLRGNCRRQIDRAARKYTIRVIEDFDEFTKFGHQAYLSFYERTGYRYLSTRRSKRGFAWWAAQLFKRDKVMLFGAYRPGGLCGVSVCYWIKDTLIYASRFGDALSLKEHVSDLMLHHVREFAMRTQGIRQVFVGMQQPGSGMDRFYELRGCEFISQPAVYHLPRITCSIVKTLLPNEFKKLTGNSSTQHHARPTEASLDARLACHTKSDP